MDSDIISTIILYAPGVAVLLWTVLKDRQLIERLMDRCIALQDKDCIEKSKSSSEQNQVFDKSVDNLR